VIDDPAYQQSAEQAKQAFFAHDKLEQQAELDSIRSINPGSAAGLGAAFPPMPAWAAHIAPPVQPAPQQVSQPLAGNLGRPTPISAEEELKELDPEDETQQRFGHVEF
jgi:hypothetical protein